MRARTVPSQLPTPPPIELGDQFEQPLGRGVNVGGQGGDLVGEFVESVRIIEGIGGLERGRVPRGP